MCCARGALFSTLGVVGRGSCGCLLVVSLAYCGGGDGLYALSGRSRSGKAADSFRMWGDDCFALCSSPALLVAADGSLDDDDDTAVGDGSIDDYDAVLFICVGLLLCAGDIVAESGRRQLISFCQLV